MKAHSKTLIVGAGGGGLSSALLASLRDEDVTLIEAHSKLGGCASWFKRGDGRAPEGFQSVTISTHVEARTFSQADRERFTNIILNDFKKRFRVNELKFFTIGAPKTFERYTGRKSGFVGGLPFLYGKNPLSLLSPLTHLKDVYRVGDTIFPGQGLCGVTAGALGLHHRLSS